MNFINKSNKNDIKWGSSWGIGIYQKLHKTKVVLEDKINMNKLYGKQWNLSKLNFFFYMFVFKIEIFFEYTGYIYTYFKI
jgi:hypothetical protein